MSDENKKIVRRWYEEIWSAGNLAAADEVVAASFVNHDPSTPDFGSGPQAVKEMANLYRGAFPDLQFTIEDLIVEGDKAVSRWTCRGTHKGALMGVPPTNKQATSSGISIFRISGGKIQEQQTNWDTLGLMRQLGAVPQSGKAGA